MKYSLASVVAFYVYLLFLALIGMKVTDKKRVIILIMQTLSISLFYGFRDFSVGADTNNYVSIYLNQENWSEIGFILINRIIYTFAKNNWRAYLFTICFITSFNLAFAYKYIFKSAFKYVNLAYWSLYCMPYTILMSINIIRQGLALSFILLGISLLFVCKKKTGIVLIILGCSVHYSMIVVCAGFFIFYYLKFNYIIVILFIVLSLTISLSGFTESIIISLPNGYIKQKFINFLNRQTGINLLPKYLFYMFNYVLMVLFSTRVKDRIYRIINKLFGFLLLGSAITYISELTATRFLLSTDYLVPIIYLYPVKNIKEKRMYTIICILLVIIYFAFIITSFPLRTNFKM
ncbi:EpsG family protein [Proteiniborus sp.]|uniref:EpsG family protein n=1 Tax=Proteiniborus sp. TaxID=2079015 RepID=UPI0033310060